MTGNANINSWSDDFSNAPSGWKRYFLVRPKGLHPALDIPPIPSVVQRFEGEFYGVENEIEPMYWGQNEPDDSPFKTTLEWRPLPYDWVPTSDWLRSFDDPRKVTVNDRYYASELLADLTNTDLPRQEIAARWFRKARTETELARDLSGTTEREEMIDLLRDIQKIIADGAMADGFTPTAGDWAERLFASQQRTSALLAKVQK
jgi:hypothetical protein